MFGALGIRPRGLLQRLALAFNRVPVPVAEAYFNMMSARTVMAGATLGLYGELAGDPASAEGIARRRGLDPGGTAAVLEALAALGYVARRDGGFVLAPRARRWLSPDSRTDMGECLAFNHEQWRWWSGLEAAVRSGRAVDVHALAPDDPAWDVYVGAMYRLARLSATEVARAIPVRGGGRVLDLGGAHGWFAAELCRRHRGVTARVLDLPGSARAGRRILEAAGATARVEHVEGDARTSPLGGPWDAVLLFQVVHHLAPGALDALLARVRDALAPGGVVAVLDTFRGEGGRADPMEALLGLHWWLTSGVGAWRREDLEIRLHDAGFRRLRWKRTRRLPVHRLCLARA